MTMSWACYCIIIDLKPIHQLADLTMTLFRLFDSDYDFDYDLELAGTALHWVGRTN